MSARLSDLADHMRSRADMTPASASKTLVICVVALVVIGLAARLSPLMDSEERLFWQYMTEDGYLMQTVARNIAIGLGMSTAEGTIPTNGVQPLATFLFAGLHFVAGGSKPGALALVTLFSVLVSAAAAYLAYRVGARVLAGLAHGRELAIVFAALWFAAPHIVRHSMNALETGVYYLALLATMSYYLGAISGTQPFAWRQRLALGMLLGMTFLARNDAVFFIGALLLAHVLVGDAAAGDRRHRLIDCLVAGATSALIAAPWLANNYAHFGSITPISGIAGSQIARVGQNLPHLPASLFEAALLFVPVPRSLEATAPVILISILAVTISLAGFWLFAGRLTVVSRRFYVSGLIYAVGICLYYGLFFGAGWFLPRYLSALSLFLWLGTCATAFLLLSLVFRGRGSVQRVGAALTAMLTIGASGFAYADFVRGRSHMHKQVVEWVQENVGDSQWVGAVQTGTLGFFHDRTINLDGKVNPEALRAILTSGDVRHYVLATKISYLVDWVGITSWVEQQDDARFANAFRVIVKDERRNLAVLQRVVPLE